jgi:hypothetical protein
MKFSRFLILLFLWREVAGGLISINEDFQELKNDLPLKTIQDIVLKQSEMIEVLSSYTNIQKNFQDSYNHGANSSAKLPILSKEESAYEQDAIDIHSDVIFVGFPASAVESIRSKWFEPLAHTDSIMTAIGENTHIVEV